jgi:hypothetical protein
MSPERASAYRRVMHTLVELGPSKLLDEEQERVRSAADALIFSHEPLDDEARDALTDTQTLCRALIESGRWQEPTAKRLAEDVAACGPERPEALQAA